MNNKNKKIFLVVALSSLVAVATLSTGIFKVFPSIFTIAQQDANSLVISANNPVHDGYVETVKGSPIYVKDDGVTWGNNNLTFADGGYIQTLTCIHGIQSVNVEISSGSLDLYHGYLEPTNLETPMYGVDFNFSSTSTFTYTSDLPNYVRLRASSGAVVNKITINYDCVSVTDDQYIETLDDGLENSYIDAGPIKTYATTSYVLDTSSNESKRALRVDFKGTTNNYLNVSLEMNKIAGLADELPDFSNAIFTLKAKFSDNITDHGLIIQAVGNNWTSSGRLAMDHVETSVNGWNSYQFDFTDVNFENNDQIIRVFIDPVGITPNNKDTGYIIFDEIDYHQHTLNQNVNYETIYDGLENVTLDYNWQNVDYEYDNEVTYGRVSRSSLLVKPQGSLGSHPYYCVILSPEAHVSPNFSEYLNVNFAESVLVFEYKPINVQNPNTIFVHFLESWSNGEQKTVTTTALSDGWYLFSYDMRQLGFTSPDMIRIKIGFEVDPSNINKAKVYFDNIRLKNEVREDYTQGLENLDVDAGMSLCCDRSYDFSKTSSGASFNSLKCVLNGDDSTTSWQNKYGPTWVLLENQVPQMTCNSGRIEARILFSGDFPDKRLWFNVFDSSWRGARFKDIEPTPIGNGWYQVSIDFATLPSWSGEKTVTDGFDFSSHPVRFGFGFHSLDSSNNFNKTVWFDDVFYYPATTSSDFTLWQAYDTENIRQNDSTLPNRGISNSKPLEFHDAKNGTDSSQLMIKANTTISSYNFRPGTLRGDNGDTLSATCFDVSIAKYFYCSTTSESDKTGYMGAGYYPDALVPIDRIIKASENTITNGNQQSIWINCAISKYQTPGTYTGDGILTVNGVDYSVPMKVVVYDVTLSDATHNKTCYLIWYDRMAIAEPIYNNVTRKAYYDFLLEKGISGDSYYEWSRWTVGDMNIYDSFADNFANYIMPNNKISTYRIPMERTEESVLNYLTALVNRNKIEWDKGNHVNFFDKAIIILSDEPSNPKWNDSEPQAWKDCKTVQNWIKSAQAALAPSLTNYPEILAGLYDVRNVVTLGCDYDRITGGSLFYKDLLNTDYLGVPCPQFQLVSPENQRQTFLSRFNHTWFYGCVNPQLPYPSYHMDTPLLGQRMIPWMQYNYGFEGTLYFCVNMFSTSDQGEAILRDVWNDPMMGNTAGDGMLLYPGARYNILGPITSMRLENIRNSMEDYELFYLMDQRLNKYNSNTGSSLTSCRDLLSSEISQMFSGTQLLTRGHTFSSGYQSQAFDEYRIYLLERLEYCY